MDAKVSSGSCKIRRDGLQGNPRKNVSVCECVTPVTNCRPFKVLRVICRAGASGPPYLPDAAKLWYGGGSTGWPPVCTCNVQSDLCQLVRDNVSDLRFELGLQGM